MNPDIKLILDLQDLDQRISAVQKEIAALPKHVGQIEKALDSHNRRLAADRAALAGNQKERKRLEGEIQVQQQKISKLREQMLGAKNNEQYRAFQNEIDFCEKEIKRFEDRTIELMAESEPLDKAAKVAEASLKKEKEHVDGEKKTAIQKTEVDKKQLDELLGRRKTVSDQVKPPIMREYLRIQKKWKGNLVVTDASDGRCTACNMSLRPQFLQDLRKDDQVMHCESCGRFLYFQPVVVIDALGAAVGTRAEPESRPVPIRRM